MVTPEPPKGERCVFPDCWYPDDRAWHGEKRHEEHKDGRVHGQCDRNGKGCHPWTEPAKATGARITIPPCQHRYRVITGGLRCLACGDQVVLREPFTVEPTPEPASETPVEQPGGGRGREYTTPDPDFRDSWHKDRDARIVALKAEIASLREQLAALQKADSEYIARTDALIEAHIEQLEAADERARKTMLALESLTPGGSEFVGDPEACVAFVKAKMNGQQDYIRKLVRESPLRRPAMPKLSERIERWYTGDGPKNWSTFEGLMGEVEALEAENERLREALRELRPDLVCRCEEAWTGRGLHQTECMGFLVAFIDDALNPPADPPSDEQTRERVSDPLDRD